MRKAILPVMVVAAVAVATVVAQQREPANGPPRDNSRDVTPDNPRAASREASDSRPAPAPRRAPPDFGGPMEMGSRLELFLMRPGRVVVRDTWRVGRVDCRPWDNAAPGVPGTLRVNAVIAYVPDHVEERAAGLELVLQDEIMDHTFFFDVEQLGDLIVGMETVGTTAETMRDPPPDVGRRAVFNLNGLEVGMAPRRSGGYLAPVGPDELSVGLNPDNFREVKQHLTEAQTILKRETAAQK